MIDEEYPHEKQLQSWRDELEEVKTTMKMITKLLNKQISNCEDNIESYELDKRAWQKGVFHR